MTDLAWAVEVVSLLVLAYSGVTLVRLDRGRRLRRTPPDPPVNVRARTSSGELLPVELVYLTRLDDGRALWTPTPSTAGAVPPDADLVAARWPSGTVVVVGYRGPNGEGMVRGIESAEEDA